MFSFPHFSNLNFRPIVFSRFSAPEAESLRTSLASRTSSRTSSRTHFEVQLALASRPQVLENCPVLGWRTSLFFEPLKFCRLPEKKSWKTFFTGERLKKIFDDLFFLEIVWKKNLKPFFLEHLRLCPWSLASSILVLGLERVWPWPRIFFVSLTLASSLVSSTPLLQCTWSLSVISHLTPIADQWMSAHVSAAKGHFVKFNLR